MAQEAWIRKLMQKSGGMSWEEQSDLRKVRILIAGSSCLPERAVPVEVGVGYYFPLSFPQTGFPQDPNGCRVHTVAAPLTLRGVGNGGGSCLDEAER